VIQRLGVREVHNLDDYMAAFGELKAGETIAVVVERKGKPLELELTPSAPNAPGGASH
jgi:S1-C subfamily serine protease